MFSKFSTKCFRLETQRFMSVKFDDSWKWNSNYFKDFWNRQQYGPIIKARKTATKDAKNSEAFWMGKLAPNQSQPPNKKNLNDIIISASASLPLPKETESVPKQASSNKTSSVGNREIKMTAEDKEFFSSKRFPLRNPSKPKQGIFAGQTIQHSRELQAADRLVSVTKVLKETMSTDRRIALQKWEDKMILEMGKDKFKLLQEQILLRGHRLHSAIQSFFENGFLKTTNECDQVSKNHLKSLKPIIERFDRPAFTLESQVVHPCLEYKGYIDCVTHYQQGKESRLVLIDWKTSQKPKASLGATFDTPLQIAAYVGALNHDSRYPIQVTEALAVIVYNDGRAADVLTIDTSKLEMYWYLWLKRLKSYKTQQISSTTCTYVL